MFDNIHEECGVFGIFENTPSNVSSTAYLGLYALQHRGQESCGIAVCDDGIFRQHKGLGLVGEVFTKESLEELEKDIIDYCNLRYGDLINID